MLRRGELQMCGKGRVLFLLLAPLLLFRVAWTQAKNNSPAEMPRHKIVVRPDAEGKIPDQKLKQGDELIVMLPAQPGTGYRWVLKNGADGMSVLGDTKFIQSASEPGATETQVIRIAARKAGDHSVSLAYAPTWDKSSASRTVNFNVDVVSNSTNPQ
jgi:predicted secreted protein